MAAAATPPSPSRGQVAPGRKARATNPYQQPLPRGSESSSTATFVKASSCKAAPPPRASGKSRVNAPQDCTEDAGMPTEMRTALSIFQSGEERRLSFGCEVLDAAFGGGVPLHGITEIAGEAGAGKTQLCLQLLLEQARLSTAEGIVGGKACVLSCGEGRFPSRRLRQLADTVATTKLGLVDGSALMDGVCILTLHNPEQQVEALQSQLPALMARERVRLVVIDTISALFRSTFGGSQRDVAGRAPVLIAMAQQMKRLSDEHNCAFVVLNQVTARPVSVHEGGLDGSGNVPALGLAWTQCVSHRFVVRRLDRRFSCFSLAGSDQADAGRGVGNGGGPSSSGGGGSSGGWSSSGRENNCGSAGEWGDVTQGSGGGAGGGDSAFGSGGCGGGASKAVQWCSQRELRVDMSSLLPASSSALFVVEGCGVRGQTPQGAFMPAHPAAQPHARLEQQQ